jgi:hypothetical protein
VKVDAALLADPEALADAILRLSAHFQPLRDLLEEFRQLAESAVKDCLWVLDWYRSPGDAWWEQ